MSKLCNGSVTSISTVPFSGSYTQSSPSELAAGDYVRGPLVVGRDVQPAGEVLVELDRGVGKVRNDSSLRDGGAGLLGKGVSGFTSCSNR